MELVECQPLKLVAKVIGKPTSIKWQKDGEDLSPSDTIKITEDADGTVTLMISNVSQKDAGKYTVIATNAEGKARSTSLVQVQGKFNYDTKKDYHYVHELFCCIDCFLF